MEEGVVNSFMSGPLKELFDASQCIMSQSHILESVRAEAEKCDSLESFFMVHSMGGGTGSGLGTYISGLLQEEYPEVYRFQTVVFPSEEDDVVTSPYNSVLALQRLTETSDCVLPVENGALMDICGKQDAAGKLRPAVGCKAGTRLTGIATTSPFNLHSNHQQKPFDQMNNVVSNLMLNLTRYVLQSHPAAVPFVWLVPTCSPSSDVPVLLKFDAF
ncbi:MAG: Tubulin/FtsZ, GTPase domain-containing protein [Olpidium bornovanus]|uniref:Tubulin/FtsZ, GTPase domain-containing protein n=1 Tax=Olpidium bornovanus TaxID=278681 RepID=A0A8H7ZM74_9FUNG|nr:MAG: Tubulin/FtsZ, GTPase domain-containing protein [Olpidium bornovanus]